MDTLPPAGAEAPGGIDGAALETRRIIHKTIAGVTSDLERFRYNRAVARIRELTNALADLESTGDGAEPAKSWVLGEGYGTVVRLIGPMTPHLGEELWRALGHETLLTDTPWPEADPALTADDTVTVAVQVNGKLRGTIDLPRDTAEDAVERAALAEPGVQRAMAGKPPRKVIVVKNRIVNVVV